MSVLLLTACFSTPAKIEHFFNLKGPASPAEGGRGPRILVSAFTSSAGYDSARLAYRTSPHEVRYFGFRQWVSEPSRMVMEMTIRHLRASKRFAEVAKSDKVRDPGAVVEGNIDAIEEINRGEKRWDARLAMTFVVRKGDTEKILLRHTFDVTRPCAKPKPEYVAREISKILAAEITKLARGVDSALGSAASSGAAEGAADGAGAADDPPKESPKKETGS